MDLIIVKFFNRLRLGWFDQMIEFSNRVAVLAILWTFLALAFLFFDLKNGRDIFFGMCLAAIFHFSVTEGIFKRILARLWGERKRPYIAYPDEIVSLGKKHADVSFPSSHMASTLAVITIPALFYPKFWPLVLAIAVLMAFSRLRSGMHYPSDVVVGSLLGILYGLAAFYIVGRI